MKEPILPQNISQVSNSFTNSSQQTTQQQRQRRRIVQNSVSGGSGTVTCSEFEGQTTQDVLMRSRSRGSRNRSKSPHEIEMAECSSRIEKRTAKMKKEINNIDAEIMML